MLTIRLSRVGKTKQPQYRFIVSEKQRDPWGKVLEFLGTYQPRMQPVKIDINKERVQYWISKGAQCSDSVWNILVDQKIVTGEKRKMTTITKRHKERMEKAKTA